MVVQCDQCSAKFRLDDSKVKEGGTKVRCSKCRHIFLVQKEGATEEPDFDSLLNGLTSSPAETPGESRDTVTPAAERPAFEEEKQPETDSFGIEAEGAGGTDIQKEDLGFGEFSFDAESAGAPAEPAGSAEVPRQKGFDIDDIDFGADITTGREAETQEKVSPSFEEDTFFFTEEQPAPAVDKVGGPQDETPSFDYDSFSFAEEPPPSVPEKEGAPTPPVDFDAFSFPEEPTQPAAEKEQTSNTAASFDADAFSFEEPPSSAAEAGIRMEAPEGMAVDHGVPPLPVDHEDFSATPPLEFSFEPETPEPDVAPSSPEPPGVAGHSDTLDFGDFDFGSPTPAEHVGEKPQGPVEHEVWEEHGTLESPPAPSAEDFSMYMDESPPLSISSRRRGGSFLQVAVTAVALLLVLLLAGGGFYFFKEGPAALNKAGLGFVAQWFGLEAKEEGGVAVRNPAAAFLNNKEAGEIFVVNGEAVNNFTKPRASIQVKVNLYGPKGEILAQKTAYCGNSLSRAQLVSLPVAELEKTMSNPFGDSLSNLAVQPGKAIPFVVVFTNVPKAAADFGIEVIGSTSASK